MKKVILFLAIVFSVVNTVVAQQNQKDTCPCPVKKEYPAKKKPVYYPVQTNLKGVIAQSFNDSIFVEDHTGLPLSVPVVDIPERFIPPTVSNLKEVKESFNRSITIKRYPAPVAYSDHDRYWWNYRDLDWLWFLLILAVVVALFILATRTNPAPSVTVHVPPAPAASEPRIIVPPSKEELDMAMEKAKETGSIFNRRPDGGYDICFQDPKPVEKPIEVKKEEEKKSE